MKVVDTWAWGIDFFCGKGAQEGQGQLLGAIEIDDHIGMNFVQSMQYNIAMRVLKIKLKVYQ
jgi:hypothetical protein